MSSNLLIMSPECERLQTRRPRQLFAVELMVFSQPLTEKTHLCTYLIFLVSVVFSFLYFSVFPNKNKRK